MVWRFISNILAFMIPIPSLPDHISKIILAIGIALTAFAGIKNIELLDKQQAVYSRMYAISDSISKNQWQIQHKREKLINTSRYLSLANKITNPIEWKDSAFHFNEAVNVSGSIEQKRIHDSIVKMFFTTIDEMQYLRYTNKSLIDTYEQLKLEEDRLERYLDFAMTCIYVGLALFMLGVIGVIQLNSVQEELQQRQLSEKPKYYQRCQSCGRKYSSMLLNGKNADGSMNPAFCTQCFDNGSFTEPDLTVNDMVRKLEPELSVYNRIRRSDIIYDIKRLERWNVKKF